MAQIPPIRAAVTVAAIGLLAYAGQGLLVRGTKRVVPGPVPGSTLVAWRSFADRGCA